MKWYEQKFVNRRDWILEYVELLNLTERELFLVLLIDFFNEHNIEISMELLHTKTGYSVEELDGLISSLCAKKYLEIIASNKTVRFVLAGLFEVNVAQEQKVLDISLFEIFESEFGRPFSQKELQKISDWNRTIERDLILYALRQASIYRKLSLAYIDTILQNWQKNGIDVKKIEEGNYHEG